jgi:hypothetical protein
LSAIVKIEFDVDKFTSEVHCICQDEVSFTEAIMMWCESNGVEIELISSIIKKNLTLKTAVEEDARSRNLLKRA